MRSTLVLRCVRTAAAIASSGTGLAAQTPPHAESVIHAGSWIVGGTGSLDVGDSQNNLSLSPQGLVFLNGRLAVGAEGVASIGSSNSGHSSTWGIGPSARLFLDDVSGRVLPFVSATVLPEWSHQYRQEAAAFDQRLLELDGSFGSTFMLSSKAGLTGEVYLTHLDFRETLAGSGTSSGGTSLYGIRFGFTVFVH
jgi:hypothetical protein